MPKHRRKKHYTDHKLQGSLFVGFLILEIILLSGSLTYLYVQFDQLVGAELYKIHRISNHQLINHMFRQLGVVVTYLFLCNLIALSLAHVIWNNYIHKILHQFTLKLTAIGQLDLRPQTQSSTTASHEVIDIIEKWRTTEHQRAAVIRRFCNQLEPPCKKDKIQWPQIQHDVKAIKKLLDSS